MPARATLMTLSVMKEKLRFRNSARLSKIFPKLQYLSKQLKKFCNLLAEGKSALEEGLGSVGDEDIPVGNGGLLEVFLNELDLLVLVDQIDSHDEAV